MESNIQTKVNRIGKAGKAVSIVLIVLLSIGAFGLLVSGIVCSVLPKNAVEVTLSADVDVLVGKDLLGSKWETLVSQDLKAAAENIGSSFRGMTLEKVESGLHLHGPMNAETYVLAHAQRSILTGLVPILCTIVALIMLLRLSEAFRVCRTPFEEPVIRRMNVFAFTLMLASVVTCIASGFYIPFPGFRSSGLRLNLTPVFIALVVLFLSMIFRYGAQLQKEADETL